MYLQIGQQFQDQKSPQLILLTRQQHSMLRPDLMFKKNESHNQQKNNNLSMTLTTLIGIYGSDSV